MKKVSVRELLEPLQENYFISGSWDRQVSKASPITEASEESFSFCAFLGQKGLQMIEDSEAAVIICSKELAPLDYKNKTLVYVDNPRISFIRLLQKYFTEEPEFGIHPSAIIDNNAEIARDSQLRPHVCIGPHCYIGQCKIGEGTIIYGNVYVYPNTRIGKNVIIHAGTVIGSDGFGFEMNEKKEWEKFPHIGGVVIEDNVEIQANCVIVRGALVNTTIGEGTKLDNLVHVAHNVKIGKHCFIAAGTIIGGSARIGDHVWIGLNATIRDWISVGNNVLVGMNTAVLKDVDDNLVVAGVPAREIRKNI